MNFPKIFLTLIVPVFNEEQRVELAVPKLFRYLEDQFGKWEVLYVDDGSTDNTYQLLKRIQTEHPALRVMQSKKNSGKGNAIRLGMKEARGDFVMFSDADFSTPIEEAGKLLEALLKSYDIAIGSRGLDLSNIEIRQSWIRENMGKIFNRIIRAILPLKIHDTQCGFKMFRKESLAVIIPRMQMDGFAFDVEMLMIGQIHGMRIAEIPVTWRNAKGSKVHPIRSSLQMLRDVIAIRRRLKRGDYN
jgi:dolichyl-phosphate beta-glucosyltransferase